MAKLTIDTGSVGNPATGDTLRTAMTKVNSNFDDVYQLVGDGSTGLLTTSITNGDLKLQANGTGAIEIDTLSITNSTITSVGTNSDITITPNGTGNLVLGALTVRGTTLSSADSSKITLAESVDITGNLVVGGSFDLSGLAVGTLDVDNLNFNDNIISSDSNSDINITPGGTGDVVAGAIRIHGTTLSADDSTVININEGLVVDGTTTVSGALSSATSLALATGATVTGIDNGTLGSSATLLATQGAIKTYVDAQDANIASDTLTFTNKTFNVEGTGNSISNIDVADLKSGVLDTDLTSVSGSDDTLASAKAIKTYVDAQVTAQDLDITADDSTALSIDLDTETLHFAGDTGITTTVSGNTVTHAIDGTVATLAGSQTLTNKSIDFDNNTVTNIEVDNLKSGVLDTDITSVAGTDTTLASAKAIKTYVDSQVTAQDLDFATDDSTALSIDLDSEVLQVSGGANIATSGSGNTITIALDTALTGLTSVIVDNITISDNKITTNASNANLELTPNSSGSVVISKISTNDVTGEVVPGKLGGTNFSNSLLIGHSTTGTLNSANDNTGVGNAALDNLSAGDFNTALGSEAVSSVSTTRYNTGVGYRALKNTSGESNTAVGGVALTGTYGGNFNTAVGRNALTTNNTGDNNVALGYDSGADITGDTANYNLTLGTEAGDNITSGAGNVIIGSVDAASATGDRQLKIAGYDGSSTTTWISGTSAGVVTIDGGIDIGDANISYGTATTTSSSAANMDTFTAATYRSAKYQVSIVDSTNTRFGIYEIFVTHDGSSAYINAQGISDTSLDLATFTADIDSGSVRVRVVPISDASTVFKFVRTVFAV